MALSFNRSFQVNLATGQTSFNGLGSDDMGFHVLQGPGAEVWVYPFTGGDPSSSSGISFGGSSWSGLARSSDGYASLINRTILERDSMGASVSVENDGRTDRQLGVTWESALTRWLTLARDGNNLRVMSYPSLGDLDESGPFWDIDTLTDATETRGSLARVGDAYYVLYGVTGREAKVYDLDFADTGETLDLSMIPASVNILDFTSYDGELFVLASDGMVYAYAGEAVVADSVDLPVQIYGLHRYRRKYDIIRGDPGESATYIQEQVEMMQYTVGVGIRDVLNVPSLTIVEPDLEVNFLPILANLNFHTGDFIVIRPGEDRLGSIPTASTIGGVPEVNGVAVFAWKITGYFSTGGPPPVDANESTTSKIIIRTERVV